MSISVSTQIRIQSDSDYFYTVEDCNIEIGEGGVTLSYWEGVDNNDTRLRYITMGEEEAIALADSIYRLFKTKVQNDIYG